MNKTTIALLTAAALGTSGLAAAQTDGPNFSGRVDIRFNDVEDSQVSGSNASSKLAISGGSDDAIAGLSTFYYARIALLENDNSAFNAPDESYGNSIDYAYTGFEGDFGQLSFGIDDDLLYKYVGAYTDLYRGVGPATGGGGLYANVNRFGQDASIQYSIDVQNFSVAAYADTADDGNGGLNRTQLAGSVNLGALDLGVAYSDNDIDNNDDQIALGGSVDVGIASFRATYLDDAEGNNPVHAAAVVPLSDIFTATVGYSVTDNTDDDNEVNAMLMADLGGGLDLNVSARDSDTDGRDGVSVGARYNF
ncbi:porin [Spiribacter vilamensis]|uniref:Porin-like protein n=1 Tax=Spiribacter vilamensis TaxID=531306 RepID=A0A4Q8D2B5_9GAMM|nr:porin [Spiribacter vilamensis]RZU99437.1 porin-like protein [Spiribacter vilamensis]